MVNYTLAYTFLSRYRVKAEVQDRTGTTTVVMFNYPAENLLDTSAKKLLGKMKPGDDSVPKELNTLLGKELVFKLKLDKYNLIEGLQDYRVSTVFTPVEGLEAVYAQKEARKVSVLTSHSHECLCHPPIFTNIHSTYLFRLVL